VIVKGGSTSGADRLAKHIARTDTNERMEVKEVRGVAAEDMREAFREMEAVATGCPNCKKPFYHASINTRADERLTDAQRFKAIDRLEEELGLTGQPRVVVVHEKQDSGKNDREHCHVVWLRVNSDTMRTISDSHNFRRHEIVARELEREFGHARVQGAHMERDGSARPERTPSHKEHQQAERTGIKPGQARAEITALWKATDSGEAFRQALQDKGWILARGDRRDFVAVDRFGGVHSLARRIEGAKVADVRTRLAGIDPKTLASAADAREVQLARLSQHEREAQKLRERTVQGRLAASVRPSPRQRNRPAPRGRATIRATHTAGKAAGGLVKTAAKALDTAANLFEGLLGGGPARTHDRDDRRPQEHSGAGAHEPTAPLDRGGRAHDPEERAHQAEDDKAKLRQQYLRDFDREVPDEKQRDADLERDRKGRERKRGE